MAISNYNAIIHSLVKTEDEWNSINTIIPENQIVYATIPDNSSENSLELYIKVGNGRQPFIELPKASFTINEINELIKVFDVKVNDVSVLENGVAKITVPETAEDVKYENENFPTLLNVQQAIDRALESDSFPPLEGKDNQFLTTDGSMVKWEHAVGQYTALPKITEINDGLVVQFVGETDEVFHYGYFYKAIKAEDYQYVITDIEHEDESGAFSNIPLVENIYEDDEPGELEVDIVDYELLDIKWNVYSQEREIKEFDLELITIDSDHIITLDLIYESGDSGYVHIESIEILESEWGIKVTNFDWVNPLTFKVKKDPEIILTHWEQIMVQPDTNNAKITLAQWGKDKGSFTLNQTNDTRIDLNSDIDCGVLL